MKTIARRPERFSLQWHGTFSLSLSLLSIAAVAILSGPEVAEAAALAPPAVGTTIWVNPEIGYDCYDGLAPRPDDLCLPPPEPAVPGPFKTLTKALATIDQSPAIGNGPPYRVRFAARWHDGLSTPYVYGEASLGPNFSGETFPLDVPPRTLLIADAANSELDPGGNPIRAIIQGPRYTGSPTALGPSVPDTLVFSAGGTGAAPDNFTSEGGLDGREIAGYGIEVRRGLRNVFLEADGAMPAKWSNIPPGPPPSVLPAMSVRFDSVWFSGDQTAYDLCAHIEDQALGDFAVTDCQFTTSTSIFIDPMTGDPLPDPLHTGQALVHLKSEGTVAAPLRIAVLRPSFTRDMLTVLPDTVVGLPDVEWGLVADAQAVSDVDLNLSTLTVDGVADPLMNQGIVVGIEFASNTGNANGLVPRLGLTGSAVMNCATFGAAIATGVFNATRTRLDISGNRFLGNGVRPQAQFNGQSTHFEWRGAALHLVRRYGVAGGNGMFMGSIASNVITGNRIGIAYSVYGQGVPGVGDVTIGGNLISGQLLYPAGYVPPAFNLPNGDGTGIILQTDNGGFGVAPRVLDSTFVVEANRIFNNQRHGVWIQGWHPGDVVVPVLRNNRTYGNGTVAAPLTGPVGDGVRIEQGPMMAGAGTTLAPTLVNETIVNNVNGFGVNNVIVSAVSIPVILNSIVYDNNVGIVVAGVPKDLLGFNFGPPTPGTATVNNSDFCGTPWAVVCGTQQTPLIGPPVDSAGSISFPPDFVLPAAPAFVPRCGGGCGPPPCPPCTPTCLAAGGSRCIDLGDQGGPGFPVMPLTDANGAPRAVGLNSPVANPDMGAVEKQTCIP